MFDRWLRTSEANILNEVPQDRNHPIIGEGERGWVGLLLELERGVCFRQSKAKPKALRGMAVGCQRRMERRLRWERWKGRSL